MTLTALSLAVALLAGWVRASRTIHRHGIMRGERGAIELGTAVILVCLIGAVTALALAGKPIPALLSHIAAGTLAGTVGGELSARRALLRVP